MPAGQSQKAREEEQPFEGCRRPRSGSGAAKEAVQVVDDSAYAQGQGSAGVKEHRDGHGPGRGVERQFAGQGDPDVKQGSQPHGGVDPLGGARGGNPAQIAVGIEAGQKGDRQGEVDDHSSERRFALRL